MSLGANLIRKERQLVQCEALNGATGSGCLNIAQEEVTIMPRRMLVNESSEICSSSWTWESNHEIRSKDSDRDVIVFRLEKEMGDSKVGNAALSVNARWVNAGMQDRWTRVSTSKAIERQTTEQRFCQRQIWSSSIVAGVASRRRK